MSKPAHRPATTPGVPTPTRRALLRGAAAASLGLVPGATKHGSPIQARAATALDDLQARLHGTLLRPGDQAFPATAMPVNRRFQHEQPVAIARCADEADVITCVAWCNEHGVSPVVRGGGHSFAGFSTTTGLLIDLGALKQVEVDLDAGRVTAGGAASQADIRAVLEDTPYFLPGAPCSTVGVGGLTLGGGIGYNARWAGLTCDHLRQTRLVTAAAELLEVTSDQHADLFWALRGGGGGNFGVNTSFTFELVEAPTRPVTNFTIRWRGADAAGLVMGEFQRIAHTAPPEFGATIRIVPRNPVELGRRRSISVTLEGQHAGPMSELQDLIAPLLALKTPPIDQAIKEMSFHESQRILEEVPSDPHAFTGLSRYASEPVPDRAIRQIVDLLVACPHRTATAHGVFSMLALVGGTLVNTPRDATAYVHRDMTLLLCAGATWPEDAPESIGNELSAWTEDVIAVLAPHTPDESYQNVPNRNIVNWEQQYYAENFPRLTAVKSAYDPRNLFTNAQGIPARSEP